MNKKLNFTQEQVIKILEETAKSNDGFNKVLKYSLEALMRAERKIHNIEHNDVSNGYRRRKEKYTQKGILLVSLLKVPVPTYK